MREETETRKFGYWPSLEFMENNPAWRDVTGRVNPKGVFSNFDKKRAGTRDSWTVLCTVNGAAGPYVERRTVTYGDWSKVKK